MVDLVTRRMVSFLVIMYFLCVGMTLLHLLVLYGLYLFFSTYDISFGSRGGVVVKTPAGRGFDSP